MQTSNYFENNHECLILHTLAFMESKHFPTATLSAYCVAKLDSFWGKVSSALRTSSGDLTQFFLQRTLSG